MRIIAGRFKKRKLHTVYSPHIRPTADRLRETIFNILGHHVTDAVVLDLFAGTGALGLEALSRGARGAVFIDHHPQALKLVQKNIQACKAEGQTRIFRGNACQDLGCIQAHRPLFDLVFMDPPYRGRAIGPALDQLHRCGALAADARIIVEHAAAEPLPALDACFQMTDQRSYGKTLVSFLIYML